MKPFFAMPADGWYNIAIAGEFPHSTGYVQVLDADAFKAIVEDIHAQQDKPNWPGILVDFDHDSLDPARPSTAAGWLTDIEERPDGLWAQIRWSDTGQKALEGGSFRFVSPVWMVDDCEDLGDKRLRPKRLMNCAITNCPNIKGMIPLTNRSDAGDKSRFSPPARPLPFVERVSVPVAALRAIEGDVLENARRPLTDKQRKFLWARSSENGGSPYQGSPTKRVRDLLKKNPNASTNDIIKARTGNRDAQATYHAQLQKTRNQWKGEEDDAREKAKADRKLVGGSSHYDWTRRSSGERKSGTKLKTGTGLPKSGKSADLDQRRGDREDAAKDRLNLATQYKGKFTLDSLNRAMDRLAEHREQRKEYAGTSHSKKPLDNRALFLANTAWEDMTDQQRRWWWATMGGSGPNGASRIDPYSPDGGTASPIAVGAGASGGVGPTRANEFWNEVYGNVDNPDWQPTMSEVDSMWGSVGTGATDDDWADFFARSSAGNQKLRDDFAEISRREAAEPVYTLPDTSFLDGLAGGFLHGMGNVGAAALDLAVGYGRQGVDFALNTSLLSAAIARLPAVKQGLDSFYFSVGGKAKDALGISYLQDQGDVSRTADTISGWSSLIGVAALDAALGMSWENLSRTPAGKLGGSLNPFNTVKAVEIPKPGVGRYEIAEIRPTSKELAQAVKQAFDVEARNVFPEGFRYMDERASLRALEESVSALQDVGREARSASVKTLSEALDNLKPSGKSLGELRAEAEARAYAREAWGMPDAEANALYQQDIADVASEAARRKMGDSMGRDVFEKATAKRELEQARLNPSQKGMTFQEYLDGVESLEPPSKTVNPKPAPAPEYDIWDEAFEEFRNGDWAQRPGAGPVSQLGTPAEIPGRPLTAPAKAPAAAPAAPKTPTAPEATPAPVKSASAAAEAQARAAWRQFGDDFADALDEARNGDVLQRPGAGPTSQLGTPSEVPNKPATAPAPSPAPIPIAPSASSAASDIPLEARLYAQEARDFAADIRDSLSHGEDLTAVVNGKSVVLVKDGKPTAAARDTWNRLVQKAKDAGYPSSTPATPAPAPSVPAASNVSSSSAGSAALPVTVGILSAAVGALGVLAFTQHETPSIPAATPAATPVPVPVSVSPAPTNAPVPASAPTVTPVSVSPAPASSPAPLEAPTLSDPVPSTWTNPYTTALESAKGTLERTKHDLAEAIARRQARASETYESPKKPPMSLQNLNQVRLEAASQPGATSTSILQAVEKAKAENALYSAYRTDVWKSTRHADTAAGVERAKKEALARYMDDYNAALAQAQLYSKSRDLEVKQLDSYIALLSRDALRQETQVNNLQRDYDRANAAQALREQQAAQRRQNELDRRAWQEYRAEKRKQEREEREAQKEAARLAREAGRPIKSQKENQALYWGYIRTGQYQKAQALYPGANLQAAIRVSDTIEDTTIVSQRNKYRKQLDSMNPLALTNRKPASKV